MRRTTAAVAAALALTGFAGGSGDAILRLLNSRAAGAPKTYAAAAEEVAAEAAQGKPLQGFVLALVSREENAPPAARLDEATRRRYLDSARGKIETLARERDNALAWYLLSLDSGDTNLLRRAADGLNAQALNAWGTLLVNRALNDENATSNAVAAMLSEACNRFRLAAGDGDANALYNLGTCHARGIGVVRDDEKAFTCFRAAAEKGHPEAINSIGWFFREGRVVEKNDEAATKWFAKSALYGNAYGQFNCALAFLRGQGVKRDGPRAMKLMKYAADGGCVEAINAYAVAVGRGDEGLAKDDRESFELFRKAAEANYPPAMENLAECYSRGTGTERDERLALEWKIRSRAAQGDLNAIAWLRRRGKLDSNGEGTSGR